MLVVNPRDKTFQRVVKRAALKLEVNLLFAWESSFFWTFQPTQFKDCKGKMKGGIG